MQASMDCERFGRKYKQYPRKNHLHMQEHDLIIDKPKYKYIKGV